MDEDFGDACASREGYILLDTDSVVFRCTTGDTLVFRELAQRRETAKLCEKDVFTTEHVMAV